MITVKVNGVGAAVVADLVARALRDAGIKTSYWTDVKRNDRQPYADAREEKSRVLVLEIVGK